MPVWSGSACPAHRPPAPVGPPPSAPQVSVRRAHGVGYAGARRASPAPPAQRPVPDVSQVGGQSPSAQWGRPADFQDFPSPPEQDSTCAYSLGGRLTPPGWLAYAAASCAEFRSVARERAGSGHSGDTAPCVASSMESMSESFGTDRTHHPGKAIACGEHVAGPMAARMAGEPLDLRPRHAPPVAESRRVRILSARSHRRSVSWLTPIARAGLAQQHALVTRQLRLSIT